MYVYFQQITRNTLAMLKEKLHTVRTSLTSMSIIVYIMFLKITALHIGKYTSYRPFIP